MARYELSMRTYEPRGYDHTPASIKGEFEEADTANQRRNDEAQRNESSVLWQQKASSGADPEHRDLNRTRRSSVQQCLGAAVADILDDQRRKLSNLVSNFMRSSE